MTTQSTEDKISTCLKSTPLWVFFSFLQQSSGRSLAHLSQQDALHILAASQLPVTMQVKSQRGRGGVEADPRGTWEPLPLNLQHLNLPLPRMPAGLNAPSPTYQDR